MTLTSTIMTRPLKTWKICDNDLYDGCHISSLPIWCQRGDDTEYHFQMFSFCSCRVHVICIIHQNVLDVFWLVFWFTAVGSCWPWRWPWRTWRRWTPPLIVVYHCSDEIKFWWAILWQGLRKLLLLLLCNRKRKSLFFFLMDVCWSDFSLLLYFWEKSDETFLHHWVGN